MHVKISETNPTGFYFSIEYSSGNDVSELHDSPTDFLSADQNDCCHKGSALYFYMELYLL